MWFCYRHRKNSHSLVLNSFVLCRFQKGILTRYNVRAYFMLWFIYFFIHSLVHVSMFHIYLYSKTYKYLHVSWHPLYETNYYVYYSHIWSLSLVCLKELEILRCKYLPSRNTTYNKLVKAEFPVQGESKITFHF